MDRERLMEIAYAEAVAVTGDQPSAWDIATRIVNRLCNEETCSHGEPLHQDCFKCEGV